LFSPIRFRDAVPGQAAFTGNRLFFAAQDRNLGVPDRLACYTYCPLQNKTSSAVFWTIRDDFYGYNGPIQEPWINGGRTTIRTNPAIPEYLENSNLFFLLLSII
jgi:hypothetical protein